MSEAAFRRNRIYGNEDYIIKMAKVKKINIDYDNFKVYDNEDGWSLNLRMNGKDYLVVVEDTGRIVRMDKNLAGCKTGKQRYHEDRGFFTWLIAFDSIKTTHNPKHMGKVINKVDRALKKDNYIKFT